MVKHTAKSNYRLEQAATLTAAVGAAALCGWAIALALTYCSYLSTVKIKSIQCLDIEHRTLTLLATRWCALVLFAFFSIVNAVKGLRGDESCGCFGRIRHMIVTVRWRCVAP